MDRLSRPARMLAAIALLAALLCAAVPASAEVRSIKPRAVRGHVLTFSLYGLKHQRIVAARVTSRHGRHRLSVRRVRAAVRRGWIPGPAPRTTGGAPAAPGPAPGSSSSPAPSRALPIARPSSAPRASRPTGASTSARAASPATPRASTAAPTATATRDSSAAPSRVTPTPPSASTGQRLGLRPVVDRAEPPERGERRGRGFVPTSSAAARRSPARTASTSSASRAAPSRSASGPPRGSRRSPRAP